MKDIDIVETRRDLVAWLAEIGFVPRDSDGTDFQFQDDRSLRFKVGTSYGEVAIAVYNPKRNPSIRITRTHQVPKVKEVLRLIIDKHWSHNRVSVVDGTGQVIHEFDDDPEPMPGDGPDYFAEHQAWEERRRRRIFRETGHKA